VPKFAGKKKKGKMVTPVVQHHLDQSISGLLKKNGVNVDDTSLNENSYLETSFSV
jgi:hypothetical protein